MDFKEKENRRGTMSCLPHRDISLVLLLATTCLASHLTTIHPRQPITWNELQQRCATAHPRATLVLSVTSGGKQLCDGHVVPLGVCKVVWIDEQRRGVENVNSYKYTTRAKENQTFRAMDLSTGFQYWVGEDYLFDCAICQQTQITTDTLNCQVNIRNNNDIVRITKRAEKISNTFDEDSYLNFIDLSNGFTDTEILTQGYSLIHNLSKTIPATRNFTAISNILDRIITVNPDAFNDSDLTAGIIQNTEQILTSVNTETDNIPEMILTGKVFMYGSTLTGPTDNYPLLGVHFFESYTKIHIRYYRSAQIDTFGQNGKDYGIVLENSIRNQSRIGIIVYPYNFSLKPKPKLYYEILKSYVADVVLVRTEATGNTERNTIKVYLNSTYTSFTTKTECAYWSKTTLEWLKDVCSSREEGWCECELLGNSDGSTIGGEYIIYQYSDMTFNEEQYIEFLNNTSSSYEDILHHGAAMLHTLSLIPKKNKTSEKVSRIMNKLITSNPGTDMLPANYNTVTSQIVEDARETLSSVQQEETIDIVPSDSLSIIVLLCDITTDNPYATFSFYRDNNSVRYFTYNESLESDTVTNHMDFSLTISPSIIQNNNRISYIVYPKEHSFKPRTGLDDYKVIYDSRTVEVILVPRDQPQVTEEQYLYIFFKPYSMSYKTKRGCAYWSTTDSHWTRHGCVLSGNSSDVCQCTLNTDVSKNKAGGEYMVFDYSGWGDSFCDAKTFSDVIQFDDHKFFVRAVSLITQCSLVPKVSFLSSMIIYTLEELINTDYEYLIKRDLFKEKQTITDILLTNLNVVKTNDVLFSTSEKWLANIKEYSGGDKSSDNLGLQTESDADTSSMAHMSVVIMNLNGQVNHTGFSISAERNTTINWINNYTNPINHQLVISLLPSSISQNSRTSFVVYPMNKSISRYKFITRFSIASTTELDMSLVSFTNNDDQQPQFVDIIYKPIPNNDQYKTMCAWNVQDGQWSSDGCSVDISRSLDTCRCDITSIISKDTRIHFIVCQYLDNLNFTVRTTFSTQDIFYITLLTLSLIGLILISLAQIRYTKWRESVSNKILLQLSIATIFYHSVVLYRETHDIYYNGDKSFVWFMALLHYFRLVHYIWMSIMSVLQFYTLLTRIGDSEPTRILLIETSLLSWTAPLIPVTLVLSWNAQNHSWPMNLSSTLALYLIPGVIMFTVHVIVIFLLLIHIFACCGFHVTDRHLAMTKLKRSALMFALFVIPPALELSKLELDNSAVGIVYTIADSIQGMVIFFYFIIFEEKLSEDPKNYGTTRVLSVTYTTRTISSSVRGTQGHHDETSRGSVTSTSVSHSSGGSERPAQGRRQETSSESVTSTSVSHCTGGAESQQVNIYITVENRVAARENIIIPVREGQPTTMAELLTSKFNSDDP